VLKKLDKLILRAFIGPFIATFLLSIFVLILQFFWLWIDDFVGKGLDNATLATVILYVAGSWVHIALPLAMLLSTIMTFGKLGESYELVAIKSAGISLGRFMRPILMVSILVTGVAFLFNNNIAPIINLRLNKLKYEVVYTKPAFDIKPGVFYERIEGYVIKLGSKENGGEKINNILIYEKGNYLQDNLILADSGLMKVSADKRFLEFYLTHGTRYEERGMRNTTKTETISISFDNYKKVFDLSSFFKVKTSDSLYKDNYRMLSIRQLDVYIDSLKSNVRKSKKRIADEVSIGLAFATAYDSGKLRAATGATIPTPMDKLLPDTARNTVQDLAVGKIGSAKSNFDILEADYNERRRDLRHYQLAWWQKFSLSLACLVLFLIGAPLGAIIRKGGLGSPLVFAVIFFVTYHLLNTVGEKMVKEGVLGPFIGTFLPIFVLLPIALFLIYKAMRDSQLFNKDLYTGAVGRLAKVWRRRGVAHP
jgi:lipopolysaccharide export system permease protein